MIKLQKVISILESVAPAALQESYDNSGLLVGDPGREVKKGLVTLDITETVLEEAAQKKCDVIFSHHPLLIKGLKSITGKNAEERIIAEAIRSNIAIYACHTNLDNAGKGLNDFLCRKLGLTNTQILLPKTGLLRKLVTFCPIEHAEKVRHALFSAGAGQIGNYDSCSFNSEGSGSFRASEAAKPFVGEKGTIHYEKEIRIETIFPSYFEKEVLKALLDSHPYEEVAYDVYCLGNDFKAVGAGMVGELDKETDETMFLDHVKAVLQARYLRHSPLSGKRIKKVAVCGGSGSFLIPYALKAGADAYITGDVKYHNFFETNHTMIIVDAGHHETEHFAKELMYSLLNEKFSNFAVLISETNTNPVNYY
jgi:dinuclear metal center YbgI/SA1388 family protein